MGKVENIMKINFESKPIYGDDGDKYIKIKIKIYAGSIITNAHNKKMPKQKAPCKSLTIIMLDSVIKVNKNYYSQTFLEECKYVPERIKIKNYADINLESDCNDETKSDNDNDKPDE